MSNPYVIGADLGGTLLKAGVVHRDGTPEETVSRPSQACKGEEGPIDALAEAVAAIEARAGRRPAGLGFAVPGAIHPERGALVGHTPHLPAWTDVPVRERVSARLGIPVVVVNDANAAALAEHRCGAARGARISMTVTVGTGVGAGIVVDGHPFTGAWGGAGELGHLPLGEGSLACRCGVVRCVEPEMSGSGLVRHAAAAGLEVDDPQQVFALAARDVPEAVALLDRLGDRLGAAIAAAVNVINPEVVVIGGGVAGAGEALFGRVREALDRYALASHRRGLQVVHAALGPRAGLVGAGLMAWDATPASAPV